jgi:hypothetical protein
MRWIIGFLIIFFYEVAFGWDITPNWINAVASIIATTLLLIVLYRPNLFFKDGNNTGS